MKKRLITLLLAVMMVVSLLPMSAFASINDFDVKKPDETRYVLRGTQWLTSRDVTGIFTPKVPANWKYDDKNSVQTINMTCDFGTMKPSKTVVFAEPGSKFLITAGDTSFTGGAGNFLVNDFSSKNVLFPTSNSYGLTGGSSFHDSTYVPSGSITAKYGTDFVKGWRGNLVSRNGRLIEIKPDAVCDPEHPHVVKVKGEWGAGGTGYVYIVIASKQDIVNLVSKDTQERSSKAIYPIEVCCLGDSTKMPAEPSNATGLTWWRFYPDSDGSLKMAYTRDGDGKRAGLIYNRYKIKTVDSKNYADNANASGLVPANFTTLPGYTASIDGTNTGGIADATGKKVEFALSKADNSLDMDAMYNWLYELAYATRADGENGGDPAKETFDGETGYYKGAGDSSTLAKIITADGRNLATVDKNEYEAIPYVIKLQTQQWLGWKINCAIVPKEEYRVQCIYDMNVPQGLSREGLEAPTSQIKRIGDDFNITIAAPKDNGSNMTVGQEYTFYDINDNAIRVRFNGWTLDNSSTPIYTPGQSKDLTSSTPRLYTFKGNWTVLNETVIVNKEVLNTEDESVDFTFTFDIDDGKTHSAYVVDKYGLPVGINEDDGSHPSTELGAIDSKTKQPIKTMTLKAGQSIYIENVAVGTTVTVSEESMPNDDYSTRQNTVTITPDGQPTQTAGGYYVYEQSDKITNVYGYYYVVHSSDPTKTPVKKTMADTNIVDDVKDGYLYAGYYSDSSYALNKAITGKPGNDFTPEAGATYYLKEISTDYACPSLVATYYKNYTNKPVSGLYLITAMDNNQYKDCGFVIADGNQGLAENAFAQTLNVSASGSTYKTYTANTFFSALSDEDVLGVASIDKTTTGVDVSVYYVTLDGVRVNGVVTKTINNGGYVGGDSPISFVEKTASKAANAPQTDVSGAAAKSMMPTRADLGVNRTMSRVSTFSRINCAAPESVETENTVTCMALLDTISLKEGATTPGNVVESAQEIETPETPDVPESSGVTITVNVNGNVTEIKGDAGDYTGKIETPKQENKIFAGWYTDEACTVPADLTNVENDVTLYAKFIKASDVKISTVKTKLLSNSFKTTVSAKGEFESASFVCKMGSKTINVNGTKTASGFVGEWSTNTKLISKVVITPTFVTADGTTVYGEAQTFTYILGLFI